MSGDPWSDRENDLIVDAYVEMLLKDIAGVAFVKAETRRRVMAATGRSEGSVEYKMQNVSFAMLAAGQPVLRGYQPASNIQKSLREAVARQLDRLQDLFAPEDRTTRRTRAPIATGFAEDAAPWAPPPDRARCEMTTAPTHRNEPPPPATDEMLSHAAHFDTAGRDERNRRLGRAGEACAVGFERAKLAAAGRMDLAERVRWTADLDGDGAGYDVESFTPAGEPRLLEVKTTNGLDRTPFHITRNELAVANSRRDEWVLFRLFDFARAPKAFELRPPLENHVELTATSFQGVFH